MTRTPVDALDYYDEEVSRFIMEKYGYDERKAFELFLNSQTYQMLADPKMEMWQFGPEGIFNIWESEKVTGSPCNSAYLRMQQNEQGISFFIYLLERYAEHLDVTADVAYARLEQKGLVDYAINMYELYHVEAIENAFEDLDSRLSA